MSAKVIVTFDPADPTKGFAVHDVVNHAKKRFYVKPRSVNFVGLQGNPSQMGLYANPENVLAVDPSEETLAGIEEQFSALNDELQSLDARKEDAVASILSAYNADRAEIIENLKSALAPASK